MLRRDGASAGMNNLIRSFLNHDQRGAVAMMVALLFPALMGFGALAVDIANSRAIQAQLQTAADAAALAASQQLPDTAAATAAALDLASRNVPISYGTVLRSTDITYGTYDPTTKTFTAGGTPPTAVQLNVSRSTATGNAPPTILAGVLGLRSANIVTTSMVYRSSIPPDYCVIVLDPNSVSAFGASGAGTFSVPNCGVQVNSGHNKAASAGNGTSVSAKKFCIVGGYSGSFSPAPVTGCAALADPLASIAEPTAPNGGTCYLGSTPQPNQTYCGTITLSSAVSLPAGLYYFKGASLSIGSGASISGTGVTWFFDSTSSLNFAANGTVSMTAPSSGTYKGISIFQSRSATTNNTAIQLTGGANFTLDGTIYTPKADLQLTGNSTMSVNSKSGYVVTNKLSYTGSSTFIVGTWGGTQALGSNGKAAMVQ